MSNDYAALLKSDKEIPVLSTALLKSDKEIPVVSTGIGKTVNTPLTSTFSGRYIKVPTNIKDPHYADRNTLASIKKNALILTFRGNRDGKVPRFAYVAVGARAP
jgi:hypothetical protein